ncbi:MAG: M20 family metallopeptidase [Clostridiaceae bacterium]|nr:M20 family metallopeptidase [Clostridiaceae bacterium]
MTKYPANFRSDLENFILRLLEIPSAKGEPTTDAPFGRETVESLTVFLDEAKRLGFTKTFAGNKYGYVEWPTDFPAGTPPVAVVCHLDVVPAGDWTDAFKPIKTADRIIGRGAIDNKGPAAISLYALFLIREQGLKPDRPIRIILGLDEESGSQCMAAYRKNETLPYIGYTPDGSFPVIRAEKTIIHGNINYPISSLHNDNTITLESVHGGTRPNVIPETVRYTLTELGTGHKTTSTYTVKGRTGHASIPQSGLSALGLAVEEIYGKLTAKNQSHPFIDFYRRHIGMITDGSGLGIACSDLSTGPLTMNIGTIDLDMNRAVLGLDIRCPVTVDSKELLATLEKNLVAEGAYLSNVTVSPGIDYDPSDPLIQTLADVFSSWYGKSLEALSIGGGTYARALPNIVAFGPNMPGTGSVAHISGEYITLEHIYACIDIYKDAIARLAKLVRD